MICDLEFWIQVASLSAVSLSTPLYIFVIVTLLFYRNKDTHLKNSFFNLWIVIGIVDVSHVPIFWFTGKMPLMGFFDSFYLSAGSRMAHISIFFSYSNHFCQVLGIVLLSVNRLTALTYPTKSEQVSLHYFDIKDPDPRTICQDSKTIAISLIPRVTTFFPV